MRISSIFNDKFFLLLATNICLFYAPLDKKYPYFLLKSRMAVKQVIEGIIRINHGAYTPDGGTWLSAPTGRKAHYDFSSGDNDRIDIDIQESFGRQDMLSVVNVSLFHKALLRIIH